MKKLFYLAFVAVVALSFGCAITNYPVITDNEDDGNFVVNTAGQSSIKPTSQTIVLTADGNYELHSAVDQSGAGDQTITTYVNTTFGDSPDFVAFTYCNVDSDGCWVTKAPNPASGDADVFDYTDNRQCDGWETLFFLVNYGARELECGRNGTVPFMQANDLTAIGAWLSDLQPVFRFGREGYNYHMSGRTLNVQVTSVVTGATYQGVVPNGVVFIAEGGQGTILERTPSWNATLNQLRALNRAHPDGLEFEISGPAGLTASIYAAGTNALYN